MKKILAICLALFIAVGVALAPADEGIGITAGIDFGFRSINPDGDFNAVDYMFIRPSIAYENNELVEGLELYAEMGLFMYNFTDSFTDDFGMDIDFWARVGYGTGIGFESYLGGGLAFDFTTWGLLSDGDTDVHIILTPDFYFFHWGGVGEFYAVLQLPMWMSSRDGYDFDMGLNFLVGWNSDFGLGVELGLAGPPEWGPYRDWLHGIGSGINFGLQDHVDAGMGWFKLKPSFTFDPFYAHLDIYIPLFQFGRDWVGTIMIPRVEVNIPPVQGLRAFMELPIDGIGANYGNVNVGFSLGARFSF